jgi:hypothetical protein
MTDADGRPRNCLSDLALDKLAAAELSAVERVATAEHLDHCPRCRAKWDAISAERVAFSRLAPPPWIARSPSTSSARTTAAVPKRRTLSRVGQAAVGAAALLAAAVGAFALFGHPGARGTEEMGERSKGGSDFGYYVLRGSKVLEGRPDEPLFPGDAVQFVFTAPEHGYLGILSLDGASRASVYYPTSPVTAPVERGFRRPLPASTLLDDVLGRETTYAVYCRAPILLEPLRAALAEHPSKPPAADGCSVSVLSFRKTAGH